METVYFKPEKFYTSRVTVKLMGIRLLYKMMNVKKVMPRFCALLPVKKIYNNFSFSLKSIN